MGKECCPLATYALQLTKDMIHAITANNEKEIAKHHKIAKILEISFYFCKPCHWGDSIAFAN